MIDRFLTWGDQKSRKAERSKALASPTPPPPVIGWVSAVTSFYRGDVELTFSFLLVLRLSLHAVYYAKNETSEQSLFVDADPLILTRFASLDAGSQVLFLFRRPTRLIEGPTLQYVCRIVYIFMC